MHFCSNGSRIPLLLLLCCIKSSLMFHHMRGSPHERITSALKGNDQPFLNIWKPLMLILNVKGSFCLDLETFRREYWCWTHTLRLSLHLHYCILVLKTNIFYYFYVSHPHYSGAFKPFKWRHLGTLLPRL